MKCSICEYNQECKNKKRLVIGDVVKVIGPQDNQCDHGGAGMRWLEGRDICLGRIYRIVRKEKHGTADAWSIDGGRNNTPYVWCSCWLEKVTHEL